MEVAFGKRKIFATIMTSLLFSLVLTALSVFDREAGESGLEIIMIQRFFPHLLLQGSLYVLV